MAWTNFLNIFVNLFLSPTTWLLYKIHAFHTIKQTTSKWILRVVSGPEKAFQAQLFLRLDFPNIVEIKLYCPNTAQSIHWKKMDFENINKESGEEKPHLNLVKLQMESMNKR